MIKGRGFPSPGSIRKGAIRQMLAKSKGRSTTSWTRFLTGRRVGGALAALAIAATVSACGSTTTTTTTTPKKLGPVTIGVVAPLTGTMAQLGKFIASPCYAAAAVINKAGGINGGKVSCSLIDDTGDPADAVPNVTKALTETANLDGIIGIDSSVAATVVPIVSNAKIPMVSSNGLIFFNTQTAYPYYWRMTPADNAQGAAMGLWAAHEGYTKVAVVLQNDVGDLGQQTGILPALKNSNIQVTNNLTIAGDAQSYQSTVYNLIQSQPQAILIAGDTQTITTIVSEYHQLNNGQVPPIITVTAVMAPDFYTAIQKVTGTSYVSSSLFFVGSYLDESTPQFTAYKVAMAASPQTPNPAVVVTVGPIGSLYDGMNVLALAMVAADSTKGADYNKYISQVTTKRAGAVVVHSFAQGVKELKAGHAIQYVGVTGLISFDKSHNSPGEFAVFTFQGQTPQVAGVVTAAQVSQAMH